LNAPYLCMDLSFIHKLLTTGFGLRPSATLHLAKSMQFNGERVETQWTLGAALHGLHDEL
jgi:Golgi nucleoside diphosphatase